MTTRRIEISTIIGTKLMVKTGREKIDKGLCLDSGYYCRGRILRALR